MPQNGGIYQTDTENLKHTVDRMLEILEEANTAYSSLQSDVDSIGSAWSGTSRDDYMKKLEQVMEKLPSLIRDMYAYAEDMKAVCGEYEKTDDEIEQIVSALGF